MENQRNLLVISLIAIIILLYIQWLDFIKPEVQETTTQIEQTIGLPTIGETSVTDTNGNQIPGLAVPNAVTSNPAQLITVNTDLVVAIINTQGGVIERLELKKQPVEIDQPENGFPLLKNTSEEIFVVEGGLIIPGGESAPNHQTAVYQTPQDSFDLGEADKLVIPLTWVSENGQVFTKTITFNRDSYLVNVDYQITNTGSTPLSVYQYAQFKRTKPKDTGGALTQLPSYTGGAVYEQEEKLNKIDFGDMSKKDFSQTTNNGWVSMMQHYFVGVFIPSQGQRTYYTKANQNIYRIGYNTKDPVTIQPGETKSLGNQIFLGPKEQARLDKIEEDLNLKGLPLTVDFGVFTVISKPLFLLLQFIFNIVGNWGWSIVITTLSWRFIRYQPKAINQWRQ